MNINDKDIFIMSILNYFMIDKNYKPVIIKGIENEIWLENHKEKYDIIRIVNKNIYNNEQFEFDNLKVKNIISQIKRKTFRLSMKVLSIYLEVGDNFTFNDTNDKDLSYIVSDNLENFKNNDIVKINFNDISEKTNFDEKGIDLVGKITKNISDKNIKESIKGEKMLKNKDNKNIITISLISINIIIFILMYIFGNGSLYNNTLIKFGANYVPFTKSGQYYRLLSSAFLHIGLFHLLCNMYSLYILGNNIEYFYGKTKYIFIYLYSAITGSLFTLIFSNSNVISAGASGAIFGLLGSLLYFGYNYRGYIGNRIINNVITVIFINLLIGFSMTNIGNAAHIGGLIGGFFMSMALGIDKENKQNNINGTIITVILTIFLIYLSFFK